MSFPGKEMNSGQDSANPSTEGEEEDEFSCGV